MYSKVTNQPCKPKNLQNLKQIYVKRKNNFMPASKCTSHENILFFARLVRVINWLRPQHFSKKQIIIVLSHPTFTLKCDLKMRHVLLTAKKHFVRF